MTPAETPTTPTTEAGRRLLTVHGHRPVEGDEPDNPDNLWCAADDEAWPCPFAQNLVRAEQESAARERERLAAAVRALPVHSISGYEWECNNCTSAIENGSYVDRDADGVPCDHGTLLDSGRVLGLASPSPEAQ